MVPVHHSFRRDERCQDPRSEQTVFYRIIFINILLLCFRHNSRDDWGMSNWSRKVALFLNLLEGEIHLLRSEPM